MLDNVAAVALAKAKVLALITASVAAGGVGGAVALSHAAPSSQLVRDVAATSTVEDPETVDAVDPETVDAVDPETVEAQDPTAGDPETEEALDPETDEAEEGSEYTLPECPADVKNHGAYVSSVAKEAPKGKDGHHGSYVSEAAKSDCGKKADDGSPDPETDEAQDPETDEAQDPETGDATDTETESAVAKTAKTKERGHGASSRSGNGHGKTNG